MTRGATANQRAGAQSGKAPLAESRIGASLAEMRGDGPVAKRGNKLVPVSDRSPACAWKADSASVWANSSTIVTWDVYEDSGDAVWTSATTLTIGTMGFYDFSVMLGSNLVTASTGWLYLYKNGAAVPGSPFFHYGAASSTNQIHGWEPRLRCNPGDTLAVYFHHTAADATPRSSRLAVRLVKEITDMPNTVGTGSTITCGPVGETWLTRDATSSNINETLTAVATVTDCKPGMYQFEYHGIYQTTATTTGVGFAAAFSGTATGYAQQHHATTGTSASTAAATGAGAGATGNLYEAQGQRTLGSLIGAVTVSVDAADTNTRVLITGDLLVTAIGNFAIQQRAESAGLVTTARVNSLLILRKLS